MKTVSIIIPAYNQAQYLAQTIESALGQTYAAVEVVVVDDGSPDSTPEVAARFQGRPNFRYIRQENTGLGGARNRGIRESTGEYLCFLDADDYFHPEKVARQVALLEADASLGFSYCDIVTVDEKGRALENQFSVAQAGRELSGDIFPSLMLGGYFPPHTVMIRRMIVEALGGFDRELGGHADYDLWLRAAAAGHAAVFVAEPLAYYRTHGDSMSKDGLHMDRTKLETFRKLAEQYPEKLASALFKLQQVHGELFSANQWLRQAAENGGLVSAGPAAQRSEDAERFPFIRDLAKARRLKGRADQVAVWDAHLDGRQDRVIWMQPPMELVFTVPTGARGRFETAVCVHPEAWEKPNAGGCQFQVCIDGRTVLACAVDPVKILSDRRWHEIVIDVPESDKGQHLISLEVTPIGSLHYRWGAWRAPCFLTHATQPAAPEPAMLA